MRKVTKNIIAHARKLKLRRLVLLVSLIGIMTTKAVPSWCDIYSWTLYPKIESLLASLSRLVPFAIGDVFILFSIVWIISYPVYAYRKQRTSKAIITGNVIEYIMWVYVWFYVSWGLNYSQQNIYSRIGMKRATFSHDEFKSFAYAYADSLNKTFMSDKSINIHATDSIVRHGYQEMPWRTMGINSAAVIRPNSKPMLLSWLSSMAGVTGSMSPFFGEFTLNTDLRPHEFPATYAHEYAHQLGIANEGEANFYSYMVCTNSHDMAVRFSGYYSILFHVLAQVHGLLGETEYNEYIKCLRTEVRDLAESDRRYWTAKRSRLVDETQNFFYNIYLHGNNVDEGMKSYAGVVGHIMAWERYCASTGNARCASNDLGKTCRLCKFE